MQNTSSESVAGSDTLTGKPGYKPPATKAAGDAANEPPRDGSTLNELLRSSSNNPQTPQQQQYEWRPPYQQRPPPHQVKHRSQFPLIPMISSLSFLKKRGITLF